jgi:crotonyl-CoA carboxylase/reductase
MAVATLRKAEGPKSLYEIGEIPPLGHVPEQMYAWSIRRERHGPPEQSMQIEVVPTWTIGDDEVLVLVMAAGVNYNGVWAGLGEPISPFDVHKAPFHVAGSDAAGIVWAVGPGEALEGRDEAVVHCNQDDGDDEECNGGDPMLLALASASGATRRGRLIRPVLRVQSRQLMQRPSHLTWEESACYTLTLATAYRMLFGHQGHRLQPAERARLGAHREASGVRRPDLRGVGGQAIGVSRTDEARIRLRARRQGGHQPQGFLLLGPDADVNSPEYAEWTKEARKFGKAIWDITGKRDVDTVFEHPGEQTFPVSTLVVKRGGMVVFCAGTTGFNLTFDARYVWMRQKRIQGSHFAHLKQATAANAFVLDRRIDPCMSEVFPWAEIPLAHTKMWKNQHAPGNMAVLVNSPRPGLRTLDDVIEARG